MTDTTGELDPSNTSEREYYGAAHRLLERELLGREEFTPLPEDAMEEQEREALARAVFNLEMRVFHGAQPTREYEELKLRESMLPEDVRDGADTFVQMLPNLIVGEALVRWGLSDVVQSIRCPGARRIDHFSAALLLASRATGLTVIGEFNRVNFAASPSSLTAEIEHEYYMGLEVLRQQLGQ